MYKIAVIYSDYPEISVVAEEFTQKKGYHIEIAKGVFDQAVQLAKRYEAEGYDLIISRSITGALIRRAVSIPVVLVEITNFDILQTLYKASQLGRKMAFFRYVPSFRYHDFNFIRELLGINEQDLQIYDYNNEEDLRSQIDNAYTNSVDVVVATGAYMLEVAKQHGFKTVMVHSSTEAIYNAFEQVEEILNLRNKGLQLMKYFSAIIEETLAGLIILDLAGNIKYINESASSLLKCDGGNILNRNFYDSFKEIAAFNWIADKQGVGQVKLNGLNIQVSKVVLYNSGEIVGYAVKFEYVQIEKS